MFESEILKDNRVASYTALENGLYTIYIKIEYMNPKLGICVFNTEPAIGVFLDKLNRYAIPA